MSAGGNDTKFYRAAWIVIGICAAVWAAGWIGIYLYLVL